MYVYIHTYTQIFSQVYKLEFYYFSITSVLRLGDVKILLYE